ncbi:GLE1-like protein-domain-containing protein [Lipomyces orientalis]|uniref:GLE1-like protein-domain-containing protein n=1 Tax=Lipomyces orientalis TaxID=1233043 RepID=A0ACC3TWN5_9ASCO
MGVYSLIVDPQADVELTDAENGPESMYTSVKSNQENVNTNHAQQQEMLSASLAQMAVSMQPLDATQLELILSRSPFRRARLNSTERVKDNMALVYNLISKWSDARQKSIQESMSLENEYVKQQREINWQMYQHQMEDEDSYWSSKSRKMWGSISEAIQQERKVLEENKRKEQEEARKREMERQRLEQEKLEKERIEREESQRQRRQEKERKDREEKEGKEEEEKRKEREDAERKKREEAARRDLEEKERMAREEKEKEDKEKEEKRQNEVAKQQEAAQMQEAEARQRALDAIQKRINTERQELERKKLEEEKAKSAPKPANDVTAKLPEAEPIVPKPIQKQEPSVGEGNFVPDMSAALEDTDMDTGIITTAVRTEEPISESAPPQYTDEAKAEQDYYHRLILYIKSDILAPVAANKEWKAYCSTTKRKIKPKLGQLTNSRQQIRKILGELTVIVDEAQGKSNLCYKWLLNFLSKSIVSQAETETTVSPSSAFPLGTLAVFMMSKHDVLRDLLIARFVKKCPYVVGYTCSVDTEEGRIRMGYKRIEGKWEDDAMYCERMGGMASVWGVMTQMGFPLNANMSHPYPMYHSWTFVSRMLNLPPESLTNAHFTVMASWWELTARRFLVAYGKQAHKLLTTVWDAWTRAASDRRYPAAARLRILGELWQEHGETGLIRPEEP